MKIDDCIDWLCRLRSEVLIYMPFVWRKKMTEALTMATDIIHKYQKIEEIYKNWCYPTHINAVEAMNKLGEVIKDGNDG